MKVRLTLALLALGWATGVAVAEPVLRDPALPESLRQATPAIPPTCRAGS